MVKNGCQNGIIKNMADSGCYFICICNIAERITGKDIDLVKTAYMAVDRGWIGEDFYMNNPAALLSYLTGKKVTITMTSDKPKTKYYVQCWYNKRTGYTHFNLPDFESLTNSVTVREGKIQSYRQIDIEE